MEKETDGSVRMRECFQLLASKGFDVNTWLNDEGESPLHAFAQEGEVDMLQVLLEVNADVDLQNKDGNTALICAATYGHAAVAALLLKHGAKTHPGIYAIHEAAYWGHAHVVTVLLARGADVLERDSEGDSPLRSCVIKPRSVGGEMDETLKEGKAEALLAVIQGGGDINEPMNGASLLHEAAANDLSKCIAVLVGKGLDPNVQSTNDAKESPLHQACSKGSLSAVRELAKLGANLDALDVCGRSPLFDAVVHGEVDCVSAMIDLGTSVTAKDQSCFTALHFAAALGDVKCAYLLIEGGASVDALSEDGLSPLMLCMKAELLPHLEEAYAVKYGPREARTRVARLLMEMNADMDHEVVKLAGEEGMGDVIAEGMKRFRNMSASLTANSITVGNTLLAHSDEVMYVRLVDRISKEAAEPRYKLNTQLVQCLTRRRGEAGGGAPASLAPSPDGTAASSVLSTLLDPGSRGFKEGEGDVVSSDDKQGKEVTLRYDGSDFTKEGFGVVVDYLTTGRVDHALINTTRDTGGVSEAEKSEGDNHEADGKSESGDGSNDSSAGRKRKRSGEGGGGSGSGEGHANKRRCLFDAKLAGKALQAAGYFCLDGMTEEVKRLMDIYGFSYEEETNAPPPDGASRHCCS